MTDFTVDDVAANAAKPASASVTPTSKQVSQHSLSEQMELAKFKAANEAVANDATFGLRFGRFKANGAAE